MIDNEDSAAGLVSAAQLVESTAVEGPAPPSGLARDMAQSILFWRLVEQGLVDLATGHYQRH